MVLMVANIFGSCIDLIDFDWSLRKQNKLSLDGEIV